MSTGIQDILLHFCLGVNIFEHVFNYTKSMRRKDIIGGGANHRPNATGKEIPNVEKK